MYDARRHHTPNAEQEKQSKEKKTKLGQWQWRGEQTGQECDIPV
jgi:hypothetical protein